MHNQGRITRWDDERGFGYIVPDEGGKDLFVHIKSFSEERQRRPVDGESVTFEVTTGREGRPQAQQVRYLKAQKRKPRLKRFQRHQFSLMIAVAFLLFLFVSVGTGFLHVVIPCLYGVMSSVSFLSYAFDKVAAKKGDWRTSENTLHFLDLLCGWPGGLIAQAALQHKTSKSPFLMKTWFIVILNCGVLLWAAPLLSGKEVTLPTSLKQLKIDLDSFLQDETATQETDSDFGIEISPQ